MKSPFGTNLIHENKRVEALKRYRILNTPGEQIFNNIVELAKTIFNTSIVHISFLDYDQQFIKASVGLNNISCVDRKESICNFAILNAEPTIFENTYDEALLTTNPHVHGPFGLRFYAGAPLITPEGFIIGTICLADTSPRQFSKHEIEVLKGLAKVTMEQTELRLTTIQDAEKQKAVNQKLAASEQHLQSILDTMAEGVGIIDINGKLTYANLMAQKIFGLQESEIKERTFDDPKWQNLQVDGAPLANEDHPMAIMMRTEKAVYDQEIALQQPDGERIYLSINAAPIFERDGKLTGGIGTFMDVTKRRTLMQQKDEFISIASHELKTPVTSLKASMQILSRMKDNPSPVMLTKLIDQGNRSLHKLSSLINDLLNTNRIAQGQLQLRKTDFLLAEVINDCTHNLTSGYHEISIHDDANLIIHADEQQIGQVLVNLINNAVKYAPTSKVICITVEKLEQEVKIAVKDNGEGISPEKIPHLFERYYRADYSGVQFSGLGLGLYISAEIVKKHGGKIGANSEAGIGSTFWFTLPIS